MRTGDDPIAAKYSRLDVPPAIK